MNCIRCNKELRSVTTNYIGNINKKIVIVENTPTYLCENCLEKFYMNNVIENINKIISEVEELPIKTAITEYDKLET